MSQQEIKQMTDLAKNRLKQKRSKKKVLHTFMMAGILDKDGQFTDNYPNLAAAVESHKK